MQSSSFHQIKWSIGNSFSRHGINILQALWLLHLTLQIKHNFMHIATAYTMTIHSIWSSFSFIQNIFSLFYCSCNLSRIKEKRLTTGTTWRASKCIYFWFNLNNHEHNPTLSPYSYYSFNQKRMQKKFLTTQCNLFQLKNVMVSYNLRPKSIHLSFDNIAYILIWGILMNCNCYIGCFVGLHIYIYTSHIYSYI